MAEEAAGPTLRTDSNRMQRILLRKHLGFPRHEVCCLEKIGLRDFRVPTTLGDTSPLEPLEDHTWQASMKLDCVLLLVPASP